ncbi:MAG: hypothetical protein C6P37_07040 [Caldibacillus debilis]|uniref:Uncharacterized protein n=1 Tax=Caldibacillus debilis TaxID=301148 RepID=A0A150M5S5_9BACI|nr:hypothetical protein B4135_0859 [Caldibacillus debilis]MBO2481238.1 hypothetical protein [Bacillaceae bacterium]MBY6271029.1 hypothetical protein [Bacillaceae bacterium]OUM93314.1 MAG: hypothetical protein BAA03_02390 [Caldibacillus debilis]REJ16762.1 MAG: hypothetical protein C6W57_07290 [Caldibacillus debilis]
MIALKILGSVKEKGLERANFRSGPHPVSAALREGRKASDQDRRDVRFPANPRGGFPRPSSFPGSRRRSPEKENPQPLVFGCGFPFVIFCRIVGTNAENRARYAEGGVNRTSRPVCLIL